MLSAAAPKDKPEVLRQVAREYFRWHTVGGMAKADVVDELDQLGRDAGLEDAVIQAVLVDALEHPFVPPSTSRLPSATRPRPATDDRLVVLRASEIEPQPVRWIWPGRLPMGKVTLVAGEPGLGKSQLTCAIAAAVTTGGKWPFNEGNSPLGSVLMFSAEDDAADTIRPRLEAAGADLDRVSIVSAVMRDNGKGRRSFNLQEDLRLLEREIAGVGDVALVNFDPVSSYLGKVDSHKNADLRSVLEPLGEMASRLSVGILAVTHLNKGGTGSANMRFIGSIAFVAAARSAYVVARDPQDKDRRLFIPTKNNVGPEGTGLSFRTQVLPISKEIFAPAILWEGTVAISAEEALEGGGRKSDAGPAREGAEEFLRAVLADGPLPTRRIESEAKEAGLAWATVRRAKDTLGIKASKTALDGSWVWALPGTEAR